MFYFLSCGRVAYSLVIADSYESREAQRQSFFGVNLLFANRIQGRESELVRGQFPNLQEYFFYNFIEISFVCYLFNIIPYVLFTLKIIIYKQFFTWQGCSHTSGLRTFKLTEQFVGHFSRVRPSKYLELDSRKSSENPVPSLVLLAE